MGTSLEFMTYVEDQLKGLSGLRFKKMFGEYGVFMYEKMVGILADDQLFIKPTEIGVFMIEHPLYAPPYPGAKDYFLIDQLEERAWLKELMLKTYDALPIPKKKK